MTLQSSGAISFADIASEVGIAPLTPISLDNVAVKYLTRTSQRLEPLSASSNHLFGASLSISRDGSTLAVGSLHTSITGSVSIFKNVGGYWSLEATLQPVDVTVGDRFGTCVSLSSDGNTLAAGSTGNSNANGTEAGAAYIYTRSGSTWSQQAKLLASDGFSYDAFGKSIGLSDNGNTLIVGAFYDNTTWASRAGSCYVFTRSGGIWTEQARLEAEDGYTYDRFGHSVSLSSDGNTAVIGAFSDDTAVFTAISKAYVFTRSGSSWAQEARLVASDAAAANDGFGYSVAISGEGNTVAIGTPIGDNTGGTGAGSVYIFTRSGSTWTQQIRLQSAVASPFPNDYFGSSVALNTDGNVLVIGSSLYENTANTASAGALYVFTRSGSTWAQQTRIQASDAASQDLLGSSVVVDGAGLRIAASTPYDDNPSGGNNAGSVYTYTGKFSKTPLSISELYSKSWLSYHESAILTDTDSGIDDQFGSSVSISGNGLTAAVSSPFDDNAGGTNSGSVIVFTKVSGVWSQQTKLLISGSEADNRFGASISLSNDGNTLAVGAPFDNNGAKTYTGTVYIYTRSGSTWSLQAVLVASDFSANDRFGSAVCLSSTDGNTLAVSAIRDDNTGGTDAGSVYIFTRSGSTWTQQAQLQASDAAANDAFGNSLSLSSDGNTLAVGSKFDANAAGTDAGAAYIFTRAVTTWSQQAKLVASDAMPSDYFGASVSLSDDGNTLAIGAYYDDNTGSNAGSVYIFTRSGSTWTQQTRIQANDAKPSELFGWYVSLSGNGSVLAVGCPYDYMTNPTTAANIGSVYTFIGSGSTWTQHAKLQASTWTGFEYFGTSVSLTQDGNTLIVGAPHDDYGSKTDSGLAYIFDKKSLFNP